MAKRYARNIADRKAMRAAVRERVKRLSNVETVRMKGTDGRKHSYFVQTDTRGRKRILNSGEVDPEGYYSAIGKQYYMLRKNARLSATAPKNQKTMMRQHGAEFRDKFLSSASNQGMITHEKGQGNMANMRKTPGAKKIIDGYEAYSGYKYSGHAGQRTRQASRYIVLFGQDGHCQ